MTDPLQIQVAGQHYEDCAIQPIEYIQANNLGFEEGCILKYLTRHQAKGGRQDIEKIKHYCDLLIRRYYPESPPNVH